MKAIHTLMFICLCTLSYGQKNNESDTGKKKLYRHTLAFGLGNYRFYNVTHQGAIDFGVLQLGYDRHLSNHLSVQLVYSFWRQHNRYPIQPTVEYLTDPFDTNNIGKRASSSAFRYFDLTGSYTFKLPPHHSIKLIAGPSMGIVYNIYIVHMAVTYYEVPYMGIIPHLVSYEDIGYDERRWGGVLGIAYNYSWLNDHLSVGAEIRGRKYGSIPFHMTYLLNVGYNFNL